jgi:hypothetical protein
MGCRALRNVENTIMPKPKYALGIDAAPPSWRSLFASVQTEMSAEDLTSLEQAFAADLTSRLATLVQDGGVTSLSSHKVFGSLSIGDLNAHLNTMDVESDEAARTLITLHNIIHMSNNAVAAALAEHGTAEVRAHAWMGSVPAMQLPWGRPHGAPHFETT